MLRINLFDSTAQSVQAMISATPGTHPLEMTLYCYDPASSSDPVPAPALLSEVLDVAKFNPRVSSIEFIARLKSPTNDTRQILLSKIRDGALDGKNIDITNCGIGNSAGDRLSIQSVLRALKNSKVKSVAFEIGRDRVQAVVDGLPKLKYVPELELRYDDLCKAHFSTLEKAFLQNFSLTSVRYYLLLGTRTKTAKNFMQKITPYLNRNAQFQKEFPDGLDSRKGHRFIQAFFRGIGGAGKKDPRSNVHESNNKTAMTVQATETIVANLVSYLDPGDLARMRVNQATNEAFLSPDRLSHKNVNMLRELYKELGPHVRQSHENQDGKRPHPDQADASENLDVKRRATSDRKTTLG